MRFAHVSLARVPPLAPQPDDAALRLAQHLGGELPTLAMPFGTEAGFFQAAGIPTVVCGPGSIEQAHQPDEWIAVAQLEAASRFLDRLRLWASAAPPLMGSMMPHLAEVQREIAAHGEEADEEGHQAQARRQGER